MSSALGRVGGAGINAYVASKHAIIGLTKTAALEQGSRRIRVKACCPGPIAGSMTVKLADEVFAGNSKSFTETVPLGRHGTPEEVAGLVSFLLSDDSTYATGTTHSVDGPVLGGMNCTLQKTRVDYGSEPCFPVFHEKGHGCTVPRNADPYRQTRLAGESARTNQG